MVWIGQKYDMLGQEVLKVDLVSQADGPFAKVPVAKEGMVDSGSHQIEFQVRDFVEVLFRNSGLISP